MTAADETRKLTTILFIDVVGYSAAAEQDQVGAAKRVAAVRGRINELAREHGGRMFNTAGDGFMLDFPLASGAVRAATTLIEEAAKPDSALPRIRAGAHLGEVMIDGDDLLGHGVNVAARLVAQAEPNSLVISDAVKSQLRGEVAASFTALGSIHLPKMREPVVAHAFRPQTAAVDWRRRAIRIAKRRWRLLAGTAAVLAIGLVSSGMLLGRQPNFELEPMQVVTHSSRPEFHPTLSPDGRYVVYMVEQAEELYTSNDLFMRSVDGGEETALTETQDFNEGVPSISPTGDRLAYARWDVVQWRESGFAPCQIIVRDFPNGLDRQVGACEGNGPNRLAWTPDGRSLVYSDTFAEEGVSRIRILDLETGTARGLVPPPAAGMGDMAAQVSPDGDRVAFVRYETPEAADVYVYNLRRGQLTRVTNGQTWSQIAWADARHLFLVTSPTGNSTELWLVRADGRGNRERLLPGLAHLSRPETAPGLLALQLQTRAINLWRVHNGRAAPIEEGNQFDLSADFSRDGVLAFGRGQSGDWLYLQRPGEQPRRLVQVPGGALDLRWSPDGRRIAYSAFHDGQARLFLIDVASGVINLVDLAGDQPIRNPAWSPDGRSIVFARVEAGGPRLVRLTLDAGAAPQPISDHGWFSAIETSEGLFAVHRTREGIWRLAPGQEPALVFEQFRPARDNAILESQRDWTVSGGRFYALDRSTPGRIHVVSRAIAGGPTRTEIDLEGAFDHSLAIDPLTGDIVFSVGVEAQSDIVVIPFRRR